MVIASVIVIFLCTVELIVNGREMIERMRGWADDEPVALIAKTVQVRRVAEGCTLLADRVRMGGACKEPASFQKQLEELKQNTTAA